MSMLDKCFTPIISLMIAGVLFLGAINSASTAMGRAQAATRHSSRRQSKKAEQEQPDDVMIFEEGLKINQYSEDGYYSKTIKHDGREWM